jgi:hypothetical protein
MRHGLQGIIPGHYSLVAITQYSDGKKVNMLAVQARNEKGQVERKRKSRPEQQTSYRRTYKNQIFFWFTSEAFLKRPISLKSSLLHPFSTRKSESKSSTKKGLLYTLDESCKEHFKCLSLDTLL